MSWDLSPKVTGPEEGVMHLWPVHPKSWGAWHPPRGGPVGLSPSPSGSRWRGQAPVADAPLGSGELGSWSLVRGKLSASVSDVLREQEQIV